MPKAYWVSEYRAVEDTRSSPVRPSLPVEAAKHLNPLET